MMENMYILDDKLACFKTDDGDKIIIVHEDRGTIAEIEQEQHYTDAEKEDLYTLIEETEPIEVDTLLRASELPTRKFSMILGDLMQEGKVYEPQKYSLRVVPE